MPSEVSDVNQHKPGWQRGLEALTEPMCAWSTRARWAALAVAMLLGVGAVLAIVPWTGVFHAPDSSHYLQLAAGRTDVMQPFVSRQLGARVAAGLGLLLGGDLHAGFLVEAALSLLFTMGVTGWLAMRTTAPRWLLAALMLVASWPVLVLYLVLPDLWYAALLACVLLLLSKEQYVAVALMMFPLMVSRESTSLTLVCFLAAGWATWDGARRRRYTVIAIATAAAGTLVVSRLSVGSQPNVEHLPEAIYVFAKVPWNFLRNVVGVLPWSDANSDLCRVPVWSMPVHLGPVHALGVCGFSMGQQMTAVDNTLRLFGILPLLVAMLWWRHRRWAGRSVLLRFALLYGGLSFVLAPVLGAGFGHLMQYAWPLFLVATPLLLDEFPTGSLTMGQRAASVGAFVVHLVLPAILLYPWFGRRIAMGLALWVVGYLLLRHWLAGGVMQAPEDAVPGAKSPQLAQG